MTVTVNCTRERSTLLPLLDIDIEQAANYDSIMLTPNSDTQVNIKLYKGTSYDFKTTSYAWSLLYGNKNRKLLAIHRPLIRTLEEYSISYDDFQRECHYAQKFWYTVLDVKEGNMKRTSILDSTSTFGRKEFRTLIRFRSHAVSSILQLFRVRTNFMYFRGPADFGTLLYAMYVVAILKYGYYNCYLNASYLIATMEACYTNRTNFGILRRLMDSFAEVLVFRTKTMSDTMLRETGVGINCYKFFNFPGAPHVYEQLEYSALVSDTPEPPALHDENSVFLYSYDDVICSCQYHPDKPCDDACYESQHSKHSYIHYYFKGDINSPASVDIAMKIVIPHLLRILYIRHTKPRMFIPLARFFNLHSIHTADIKSEAIRFVLCSGIHPKYFSVPSTFETYITSLRDAFVTNEERDILDYNVIYDFVPKIVDNLLIELATSQFYKNGNALKRVQMDDAQYIAPSLSDAQSSRRLFPTEHASDPVVASDFSEFSDGPVRGCRPRPMSRSELH